MQLPWLSSHTLHSLAPFLSCTIPSALVSSGSWHRSLWCQCSVCPLQYLISVSKSAFPRLRKHLLPSPHLLICISKAKYCTKFWLDRGPITVVTTEESGKPNLWSCKSRLTSGNVPLYCSLSEGIPGGKKLKQNSCETQDYICFIKSMSQCLLQSSFLTTGWTRKETKHLSSLCKAATFSVPFSFLCLIPNTLEIQFPPLARTATLKIASSKINTAKKPLQLFHIHGK